MQNSNRKKSIIITAASLVLVIGAIFLVYLFGQRPNDKSYEEAINSATSIASDTELLDRVFDTTYPIYFASTEEQNKFIAAVDSYKKSLDQLEESIATRRGFESAPEYNKIRANLQAYKKSVSETAESIRIYYVIAGNCGFIRFSTPEIIADKEQENCEKVFQDVTSAPQSNFKSQFLVSYADIVERMLKTYRSNIATKEESLTELRREIEPLYAEKSINYGIAPSPLDQIKSFRATLEKEGKAFIR